MFGQKVNFALSAVWAVAVLVASNRFPQLMPGGALDILLVFGGCGLACAFILSVHQAKTLFVTEAALLKAGRGDMLDRSHEAFFLSVSAPVVAGEFLAGFFTNFVYVRNWQDASLGAAVFLSLLVAVAFGVFACLGVALGVAARKPTRTPNLDD
jgi:hypothetical protein